MIRADDARPFSLVDLGWRTAYRTAFPLARLLWRLRQRPHEGALVAVWIGPKLLLLRSSYRRTWNLPGGSVRPGESPADAARRELVEEIGLTLPELTPAGFVDGIFDGRPDRVHLFEVRLERLDPIRVDNREIVSAHLVERDDLPRLNLTGPVAAYLARLGDQKGSVLF